MEKVFGKAFRIVGQMKKVFFLGIFGSTLPFFATFPVLLVSSYIRFEKSLPPAQLLELDDKVVLDPLN